jgi:hypothetical protein
MIAFIRVRILIATFETEVLFVELCNAEVENLGDGLAVHDMDRLKSDRA